MCVNKSQVAIHFNKMDSLGFTRVKEGHVSPTQTDRKTSSMHKHQTDIWGTHLGKPCPMQFHLSILKAEAVNLPPRLPVPHPQPSLLGEVISPKSNSTPQQSEGIDEKMQFVKKT